MFKVLVLQALHTDPMAPKSVVPGSVGSSSRPVARAVDMRGNERLLYRAAHSSVRGLVINPKGGRSLSALIGSKDRKVHFELLKKGKGFG